jgi:acetylornithine aminotransferase
VQLNPAVEATPSYPFLRIAELRELARASDPDLIDLSVGQPTDPAPQIVREALIDAAATVPLSPYPPATGLPQLREAIAAWLARRHEVALDPDRELIPTLGSKEPIAQLASLFAAPGDAVAVTSPGYPVPERSARMAGLRTVPLVLTERDGWLPDPDAVPWDDVAIVWITNPHNPTGAVAPLTLLEAFAARCRAHGAILAVDEAYSELWFGDQTPPPSALALEDRRGVVVFNTLSKRSGVPGLRSGFAAGDERIVARLARHRAVAGTTPPLVVQQASIPVWRDEEHVVAARARYAARRALLAPAAQAAGLEPVGGAAGMFLWLRAPGPDDERMAAHLLERSLLTMPGSLLGSGGEGHLRAALTPPLHELERAAKLLANRPLSECA